MRDYNYEELESKWQKNWEGARLFESDVQNGKPKFFIIFAYPGVSGFLHVGHMRGFTYADIIARYKRMRGFNVLFPAGFHASGLPSVSLAKRIERKDADTIEMLKNHGVSDAKMKELTTPEGVVDYFSNLYINDYWKKFGFSIDYRRSMSTISPGYKKFISWQFEKLKERSLLVQKPHFAPSCPNCGPVAIDASETDISKGGSAEVLEFALIYFKMDDGTILPASTLRPETIYGVTNMWLNPDVVYVKVSYAGKTFIMSEEGFGKFSNQKDDAKKIGTIKGANLIGKFCTVPYTDKRVIILPSRFVDPAIATGVVMSVPAHAPYDWMALACLSMDELKRYGITEEQKKAVKPVSIITTEEPQETRPLLGKSVMAGESHSFTAQNVSHFEESDMPAIEICTQLGIKSIDDRKKLDDATQIVYKKEFHTGRLKKSCGKHGGQKVSEIKEPLQKEMEKEGFGGVFFEFSEEVVCRCGTKVIIKKVPDQWFIKYSDETLKRASKEQAASMNIFPKEYQAELPRIIDWFDDRACIRQGQWLGTEFPFKKNWIIEPISDSTLYPAYYMLAKYVKSKEIAPEDMTSEFFDYVFCFSDKMPKQKQIEKDTSGKTVKPTEALGGHEKSGNTKNPEAYGKMLQKIRTDFGYWYPLDINLGGKEHKTVHFPVFLMNHVAIMGEKHRPRGIFVHWWVTQSKGGKISKSKGGAEPIPDAAKKYSIDGMRLYYAHIGSADADVEWGAEAVLNYKQRNEKIWFTIMQILEMKGGENGGIGANNGKGQEHAVIDEWLESVFNAKLRNVTAALDNFDLRIAANEIFFEMYNAIRWYIKRGGTNKKLLLDVSDAWLRAMAPFAPHLAEELWNELANAKKTGENPVKFTTPEKFITSAPYPTPDASKIKPEAELAENYLEKVMQDINEILKVTKMTAKKIVLYTSPEWKQKLNDAAAALHKENKLDMGALMKDAGKHIDMKKYGKELPKYAQKLVVDLKKMGSVDLEKSSYKLDEKKILEGAKAFLEAELGASFEIYSADQPGSEIYDPKNKRGFAAPRKPAIYIE